MKKTNQQKEFDFFISLYNWQIKCCQIAKEKATLDFFNNVKNLFSISSNKKIKRQKNK